jgi:hypothetical protein
MRCREDRVRVSASSSWKSARVGALGSFATFAPRCFCLAHVICPVSLWPAPILTIPDAPHNPLPMPHLILLSTSPTLVCLPAAYRFESHSAGRRSYSRNIFVYRQHCCASIAEYGNLSHSFNAFFPLAVRTCHISATDRAANSSQLGRH